MVLVGAACSSEGVPPEELDYPARIADEVATYDGPIAPLPRDLGLPPERVQLGRRLFEDPALSGNGQRACTECHALDQGGIVPLEARSNHPMNATGPYNVLTVFNVAFNFRYNWNGRFFSLEDHLDGLMMKPTVMDAGSWDDLVEELRPTYGSAFVAAGYRGGISGEAINDAINTYQRSLVTPSSRFDRYLRHEIELSDQEEEGWELFQGVGCVNCHQGINVGGNMFQRYGVMDDPFRGRDLRENDYGRQVITGREEDAFVFRVPSLRNVEVTPPYFHDGSGETLEEAVKHMGRVQLGYVLTEDEASAITAFLRSLTGEHDGARLVLPPNG